MSLVQLHRGACQHGQFVCALHDVRQSSPINLMQVTPATRSLQLQAISAKQASAASTTEAEYIEVRVYFVI